jgi:ATP-binding cassette, subfamily B, bacterial
MSRSFAAHGPVGSDPSLNVRPRNSSEVVRRIARYLRPYPLLAAGVLACAVFSLTGAFAYPRLVRWLIDDVIGGRRADALPWAALGLLAAFAVRDAANSLRIRLNNLLEQNVALDLRREVFGRIQRLPVGWFDARATGDLATRVIEDVSALERLLIDGTEQGVVAVLSIIGVTAILFVARPSLALAALAPTPFLVAGALAYTLTAHSRYRSLRKASAAVNSLLLDTFQGVRQVKLFGRENHEDDRFASRAGELRAATLRVMKVWSWYNPAMNLAAGLGTAAVLVTGGRQVVAGEISLGQLVEFVGYLGLLYEPIGRLHSLNQMLAGARAAGERVFDVLDATGEPKSPGSERVRARGEIVFEDVVADYGAGRRALHGVSFHVAPGKMVALVGATGSGKSTIANLLPRFYERTGGRILLDGRDLTEWPLDVLRDQFALVSQEPFLFNGTIGENILYGRLDASRREMEAAAGAANCDEFVRRLPDGFDTQVGERGVRLSVGQKQRITIARALLKDAPILILDEATASVDTATERWIQEAFERLLAGRTALVIAHRLSTILNADEILVLADGRIAERGVHADLVAAGGIYSRLWRAQAAAEESELREGFVFDMGAEGA